MIRRVVLPLFTLVTLFAVRTGTSGEVVCFSPGAGKTCSASTLQHVPFKAVVAEFIDPQQTTIGHSVSRLMWREVLESIYDLKNAGVILAHDARDQLRPMLEGRDYETVLQKEYHTAAIRVAKELGAQMTIWGAVLEHDGTVYVEPYLTLLPRPDELWTQLQLRFEHRGVPDLTAEITNQRLSFAPLQTDRARLFQRAWLTRCRLAAGCPQGIQVRKAPGNDASVIGRVPVGSIVTGRDMHEQWVAIDQAGDGAAAGYINVYNLEVVAPAVHVLNRAVGLRARPDSKAPVLSAKAPAGATLKSLEVRRATDYRLWHSVEVNGVTGWLPPETVQRDYNFPVVHFIAGVYRYARSDYRGAIREFQRFIERGRDAESNVTLATAYQYLAASKVAAGGMNGIVAARDAVEDMENASRHTPYDPNVYVMSSVVRLGTLDDPEGALADLRYSLDLDSQNRLAAGLLTSLAKFTEVHRTHLWVAGRDPAPFEAEVASLRARQQSP